MFHVVLAIHSLLRWSLLISLIYTIYTAYSGWFQKGIFTKTDGAFRTITTILTHIQLLFGLLLYGISPNMDYFIHNFKDAVHESDIRFFAMDHTFMMLIAIVIITIGSVKAKRKEADVDKFKTIAIWFSIGLLIILLSIPWPFMPFASRPLFRI